MTVETFLFILLIVYGIVMIFLLVRGDNREDLFCNCLGTIMLIFLLFSCFTIKREPKAIDVYRGKTDLVITYKDSVPVDSLVIWQK